MADPAQDNPPATSDQTPTDNENIQPFWVKEDGLKKLNSSLNLDQITLNLSRLIQSDLFKTSTLGRLGKINLQLTEDVAPKTYEIFASPNSPSNFEQKPNNVLYLADIFSIVESAFDLIKDLAPEIYKNLGPSKILNKSSIKAGKESQFIDQSKLAAFLPDIKTQVSSFLAATGQTLEDNTETADDSAPEDTAATGAAATGSAIPDQDRGPLARAADQEDGATAEPVLEDQVVTPQVTAPSTPTVSELFSDDKIPTALYSRTAGYLTNQVIYDVMSMYNVQLGEQDFAALNANPEWGNLRAQIQQQIAIEIAIYARDPERLKLLQNPIERARLSREVTNRLMFKSEIFSSGIELIILSGQTEAFEAGQQVIEDRTHNPATIQKVLDERFEALNTNDNPYLTENKTELAKDLESLALPRDYFQGSSATALSRDLNKLVGQLLPGDPTLVVTENITLRVQSLIQQRQDPKMFMQFLSNQNLAAFCNAGQINDQQAKILKNIIIEYWNQERLILYRLTGNPLLLIPADYLGIPEEYQKAFDRSGQLGEDEKKLNAQGKQIYRRITSVGMFETEDVDPENLSEEKKQAYSDISSQDKEDITDFVRVSKARREFLLAQAHEAALRNKNYAELENLLALEAQTSAEEAARLQANLNLNSAAGIALAVDQLNLIENQATMAESGASFGNRHAALRGSAGGAGGDQRKMAQDALFAAASKAHPALAAALKGYEILVPEKIQKKIRDNIEYIIPGIVVGTAAIMALFLKWASEHFIPALFTTGGALIGGLIGGPAGFLAGAGAGYTIGTAVEAIPGQILGVGKSLLGTAANSASSVAQSLSTIPKGIIKVGSYLGGAPVAIGAAGGAFIMLTTSNALTGSFLLTDPYLQTTSLGEFCWPTTGTITDTAEDHDTNRLFFGAGGSAVDIGAKLNEPVIAPFDGQISYGFQEGVDAEGKKTGPGYYAEIVGEYTVAFLHFSDYNTWNGGSPVFDRWQEAVASNPSTPVPNGSSQTVQVMAGEVIGFVDESGNSFGNHLHYEVQGADIQDLVPQPIEEDLAVSSATCGKAEGATIGDTIAFGDLEGWVAEANISIENVDVGVGVGEESKNGKYKPCTWGPDKGMSFAMNANHFFYESEYRPKGLAAGSDGFAGIEPESGSVSNWQTFTITGASASIGGLVVEKTDTISRAVTGTDPLDIAVNDKVGRTALAVSGSNIYLVFIKQATAYELIDFMEEGLQQLNYISLDSGNSSKVYVNAGENNECWEQANGAVPVSIGVKQATISEIVPEGADAATAEAAP